MQVQMRENGMNEERVDGVLNESYEREREREKLF